jgi:flagellar export protein FliJ
MNAFRFGLQKVLHLREQHEHQVAAKLSDAEAVAVEAREAHRALDEIRNAGTRALQAAHSEDSTVGRLRTIGYVIEQFNQRVVDAQSRVHIAEERVDQAKGELMAALQARRVLTRLRDRHFVGWRTEHDAEELRKMDELALVRHARRELTGVSDIETA